MNDNHRFEVRPRSTPSGGAEKKPAPSSPDNLGQEGETSPLKRNTTAQGDEQDRGP